jgi:hypothetical protein
MAEAPAVPEFTRRTVIAADSPASRMLSAEATAPRNTGSGAATCRVK